MAHATDYQSIQVRRVTPLMWDIQVENFLKGPGRGWSYKAAKEYCVANYPGIDEQRFNSIYEDIHAN